MAMQKIDQNIEQNSSCRHDCDAHATETRLDQRLSQWCIFVSFDRHFLRCFRRSGDENSDHRTHHAKPDGEDEQHAKDDGTWIWKTSDYRQQEQLTAKKEIVRHLQLHFKQLSS